MPEVADDNFLPCAIVLAAGSSSRLGQPKQLVSVSACCEKPAADGQGNTGDNKNRSEPLLRRTVRLALSAVRESQLRELPRRLPSAGSETQACPDVVQPEAPVLVVLANPAGASGPVTAACQQALAGLPVGLVYNPQSAEGMGTSIHAAMVALPQCAPAATHVLLLVCDQPLLTPAHLQGLMAAARHAPQSVAAAFYSGRLGVPALFPRRHFPDLQALSGDQGARSLLQTLPVVAVPLPEGAFDLDTADDLRRLSSQLKTLRSIP